MTITSVGAVFRLALIFVFATSAIGKLRTPESFQGFAASVSTMTGLRRPSAVFIGMAVACSECAVVVLLALPSHSTAAAGFALSIVLLVAFVCVIVRTIRNDIEVSCRCFGSMASRVGWGDTVRNSVLLIFAGAGLASSVGGWPRLGAPAWILIALASLAIAMLAARFDDVSWVFGWTDSGDLKAREAAPSS